MTESKIPQPQRSGVIQFDEKLCLTPIPVFFAYNVIARIRPAERALSTTTP